MFALRCVGKCEGSTPLLNKLKVRLDEGTFEPRKTIRFDEWADRWLASIETKPNTVTSYTSTLEYAKQALGSKPVRSVDLEDIGRLNALLRETRIGKMGRKKMSDSTRAKHLRVLSACFNSLSLTGTRQATRSRNCLNLRSRSRRRRKPRFSKILSSRWS